MCKNVKRKKNHAQADSGSFDGGGGGGVHTLVKKGLVNFFVANYFSRRRPRGS